MKRTIEQLGNRWKALAPGRRIGIIVAVAAVIIGGYVAFSKLTEPNWAVLYANLDDKTASDVLSKLDARGVQHKLEGNGTRILVPKEDLASTRLALASEGVTGQPVPPGFEEIFAGQGLATSDFEQKVNYQRALEGELARTLLAMDPVKGASVRLSLPQKSVFIGTTDQQSSADKATASVLLSLKRPLTSAEIDTVANLVASSVEGLTPDQVTIASADGGLLHAAGDSSTAGSAGASTKNLDVQRDYERTLSDRLTELARTMTGSPGATVEVRADLDFTAATVEHEVIDPTKQVATADHTLTEKWSGTGTPAGGTTGIDGGPIGGTSGTGTYDKSDQTTTYTPGDRTVTRSTETTPTVKRLNLAVVVPVASGGAAGAGAGAGTATGSASGTTTVDQATIQRVLASAAGLDTTRGDTIEVALVPATVTDQGGLVTTPTPIATKPKLDTKTLGIAAGAGAAAMFLLVVLLLGRKKRKRKAELRAMAPVQPLDGAEMGVPVTAAVAAEAGGKGRKGRKGKKGDAASAPEPTAPLAPVAADPEREAMDEIRADLERMLAESPESLAALLSSWMSK